MMNKKLAQNFFWKKNIESKNYPHITENSKKKLLAQPATAHHRSREGRSPCLTAVLQAAPTPRREPPAGSIFHHQGLRFRFWKKFRWPPETVYRPKFRGFPVISIGKSFQIQNSEISVYRPVFRCISPVFRCFSPKNDGNSWKMMGKLCICEKKLKILGSLP